MTKTLIIAEKPSVANDIAKTLGGFTKHDEYFESDEYVLSSAVGHLLEITVPEEYDVKRGKWSFAHLPMIPPHFDLNPIDKTESRLKVLNRLIKRKDVDALINACDAGPRRRADLPLHRPARQGQAADQAPVAAVDDAGAIRDGFEPPARRRRDAAAGRCRALPLAKPTGWSASTAPAR